MALIDSLNAELAQVVAIRAQVIANPRPQYSLDGESYSWESYYQMLVTQQEAIEKAIQRAAGPFMISTRWKA